MTRSHRQVVGVREDDLRADLVEIQSRCFDLGADLATPEGARNADRIGRFVDADVEGMEALIDGILWVLQTPHPFVIFAFFIGLTWMLQRSWKTCLLVALGFLFILNQGYWEETTESLTLVLSACVVCMAVGVPIGIAAAHRPRLYAWMRPVLDLMQTLPAFVYLIPIIAFFGTGNPPGILATIIFGMPPVIRRAARWWKPSRAFIILVEMTHVSDPCSKTACTTAL